MEKIAIAIAGTNLNAFTSTPAPMWSRQQLPIDNNIELSGSSPPKSRQPRLGQQKAHAKPSLKGLPHPRKAKA